MNLFLVENKFQVNDILNEIRSTDGWWIALEPSAMHELSRRNIDFLIPEDFVAREEIEVACSETFERLKTACERLDALLLSDDPFLDQWQIRPFLFNLWPLSMVMDGLVARTFQLKRIIDRFPGFTIYTHLAPPQAWGSFGINFSPGETLYGRLLSLTGWDADIRFIPKASQGLKPSAGLLDGFKTLAKKNIFANSLALSRNNGLWKNVRNLISSKWGMTRKGILVVNGIYDWKPVLASSAFEKNAIYFLKPRNLVENAGEYPPEKHLKQFKEDLWDVFHDEIKPETVDFLSVIKDRVAWIRTCSPVIARDIVKKAQNLVKKESISVVLNAVSPDFPSHVFMQCCRKMNVPVIKWQHGSVWCHERISQRVHLSDLIGPDIFLVYGDAVKQAYESYSRDFTDYPVEILSIGSSNLDHHRKKYLSRDNPRLVKKEDSQFKILYVITNYYCNSWYCGFSPPFSDTLYYKDQCIIINRLKKLLNQKKGISLTVKLYPGDLYAYDPPWIDELNGMPEVTIIRFTKSSRELLFSHDAILLDFPSTTLLESLSAGCDIFLLQRYKDWSEQIQQDIKRRLRMATEPDALMDELEKYINGDASPLDGQNIEFLKQYGLHTADENSVGRALKTILPLI